MASSGNLRATLRRLLLALGAFLLVVGVFFGVSVAKYSLAGLIELVGEWRTWRRT